MAAARPEAPSEEELQWHLQLGVPMDFLDILIPVSTGAPWVETLELLPCGIFPLRSTVFWLFLAQNKVSRPAASLPLSESPPAELCDAGIPDYH